MLQHRLLTVTSSNCEFVLSSLFGLTIPQTATGRMEVQSRLVGLYHRADCIECGIESDCFSLSRLHVGVIHWVFK